MRVGIIARMDKTGLANQTRNLVYMLNPSKVLVIDSRSFSRNNNKNQYADMYKSYNAYKSYGFISPRDSNNFLRDLDVLISCELFYGDTVVNDAKRLGVKTLLQYNYEFLGNLQDPRMPVPDLFLAPSYWKLGEMQEKFPNTIYLPPPIDEKAFTDVTDHNMNNHGKRFLHVVGNPAVHDRKGTQDLLAALEHTDADFELVIKAQANLELTCDDPRVTFDYSAPNNEVELYRGYDAMVLPRRYAGLCLPMNEALMAGLPVIMTDIEPNNKVLPKKWLVKASKRTEFMAKAVIDVHESNPKDLAKVIDRMCKADIAEEKREAWEIAIENYSFHSLRLKYLEVINETK